MSWPILATLGGHSVQSSAFTFDIWCLLHGLVELPTGFASGHSSGFPETHQPVPKPSPIIPSPGRHVVWVDHSGLCSQSGVSCDRVEANSRCKSADGRLGQCSPAHNLLSRYPAGQVTDISRSRRRRSVNDGGQQQTRPCLLSYKVTIPATQGIGDLHRGYRRIEMLTGRPRWPIRKY